MNISKKIAVLALTLAATTAQGRDNTVRYDNTANSNMSGGFGFNMSFSGRSHATAGNGPRPIILRGVNFKFDSAELTSTSKKNLDSVAEVLSKYEGNKLDVVGHASAEGEAMYNLALSTRRARSVRNYLIKQGVTPTLLSSTGHGEMYPIANNVTEQGRSLNRRVELAPLPVAF